MRWLCAVLLLAGCQTTVPRRDINVVLNQHAPKLMTLPGVVGVYGGLMNDGRSPCVKVMLGVDDPDTRRLLPRTLEGYPVLVDVTGPIKPMRR